MDIYLPYIPQVISSLLFCAAFTLHICNGNRPRLASALIDCGSMALILARCIADGGLWPHALPLLLAWGNVACVRHGYVCRSSRRQESSVVLLDATQMVMLMTAASTCDYPWASAANAALATALVLHMAGTVATLVIPRMYDVITARKGMSLLAIAGLISAYVVWKSPCCTPILPFVGGFYYPMTDIAWMAVSLAIACSEKLYSGADCGHPNDLVPWLPSVLIGLTFSLLGDTAISLSLATAIFLMLKADGQPLTRCTSTLLCSSLVAVVTSLLAPNSSLSWRIWALGPLEYFPSLDQRLTISATFSGLPLIGSGVGRLSCEMLEAPEGIAWAVSQTCGTFGLAGFIAIVLACLAALLAGVREIHANPLTTRASGCLSVVMGVEMMLSLLTAIGLLPNLSCRGVAFAGVEGCVVPILQSVCISITIAFDSFVSESYEGDHTMLHLPPAGTDGEVFEDEPTA